MEGQAMKTFALLLLFFVCNPAKAQPCELSDLVITQKAVSSGVTSNLKYRVTVENQCICPQANIKLYCPGLRPSAGIDRDVLSVDGGKLCTLNGGRPIGMGPDSAVGFSYVGTSPFRFTPVSSTITCS
nr:unnamed protein product [Digitaria exilis]